LVRLPVIVGFGGINPAGRSSFHHGYRRLVLDVLDETRRNETLVDLAMMMNLARFEEGHWRDHDGTSLTPSQLAQRHRAQIERHTLIRRIEQSHFDVDAVPFNRKLTLQPLAGPLEFALPVRQLPEPLPPGWQVTPIDRRQVKVTLTDGLDLFLPDQKKALVSSAGQLPSGFDPGALYPSRNHPRALQMALYAASDALGSLGIDWNSLLKRVAPDQIAVYASSSMGQLDDNGTGGMYKAPYLGKRISSKQLPLGFAEMPADFVNAYVLGSVGATGGAVGACATFLYNLRSGVEDIRSGRRRVVLVGATDAVINPEAMEGYTAMGALAEDAELIDLDHKLGLTELDHRRACRPFNYNCGFTMGESAQFLVLFDDALALEMGAQIHGAVPMVSVHADGFKKSIAGPGIGNYLTVGKAMATARDLIGEARLRQGSYMHAHGTGTPQNRVTESRIFNEFAKLHGIEQWPVAAIKCYLGHALGAAAGDQVATALGVWRHGFIPGIFTLDQIAEDVHHSHLRLERDHIEIDPRQLPAAFINAKGFGGNNATALLLSPLQTESMLARRHGRAAIARYWSEAEQVRERAEDHDRRALRGEVRTRYQFGEGVCEERDLLLSPEALLLPGDNLPIALREENPYPDLSG